MHPIILSALLTLISASFSLAATAAINLPDIGNPADQFLTPEKEKKLGLTLLRRLRKANYIIDDPLLDTYINSLGDRVLTGVSGAAGHYTFFILRDSRINAFAAPGGFIGINAGLILATQSEDELASVLAHEIAHVQQRHAARAMEASKNVNIGTAAALIAAILIGGSDSQAGEAAIYAGLAGSSQYQINFTRENEHEADRIGIDILAKAGFEPRGMVGFFKILQKILGQDPSTQIEYLRTHPISTTRVAEAQDRAKSLRRRGNNRLSDYRYAVTRTHTLLKKEDPEKSLAALKNNTSLAAGYARALNLHTLGRNKSASLQYKKLLKQQPENLWFRLGHNKVLADLGQKKAALHDYQKLAQLYPNDYALQADYTTMYIQTGQYQKALAMANQLLRQQPQKPWVYHLLGKTYALSKNQAAATEVTAEYHFLQGDFQQAILLLERILKGKNINGTQRQRISERKKQIETISKHNI